MPFEFYLGVHRPAWLAAVDVPLFVSARQLALVRRPPRARCRWALDSGGFSELSIHGKWTSSAAEYAQRVRVWSSEVGSLEWAAIQDWMVEPQILARTGFDVAEHQKRTIQSYEDLRAEWPEFSWLPVLQGWEPEDYLRHAEQYAARGHDLAALPRVGIGSVCRRQKSAEVEGVIRELYAAGVGVHAFGFKATGLRRCASVLRSSDSMAWSYNARRNPGVCPGGKAHRNCANCLDFALAWRDGLLEKLCYA
jgi:hypothetical protein